MISPDIDRVFRTFKVVTPGFKCTHNCEEFLVVNVVVSFSRGHSFGEVCNWVPVTVVSLLLECGANGEVQYIAFNVV